jgi:hypothetical protein
MRLIRHVLPALALLATASVAASADPVATVSTLHPSATYAGWLARATANGLHPGPDLAGQIRTLASSRRWYHAGGESINYVMAFEFLTPTKGRMTSTASKNTKLHGRAVRFERP